MTGGGKCGMTGGSAVLYDGWWEVRYEGKGVIGSRCFLVCLAVFLLVHLDNVCKR